MTFWADFERQVEAEVGVPQAEVGNFMNGISRTGRYQELVGYYDNPGGKGKLTATYRRLVELVSNRDE